MSDRIRLSLWFERHPREQVLPRLVQAAQALPPESAAAGVRGLTVRALDWGEPPVLEERPQEYLAVEEAVRQMEEFVHDDCACELELAWPLWRFDEGWSHVLCPVTCISLGPGFAPGAIAGEGHLQVDFGLDEVFLAEMAPWNRDTRLHLQTNILQLLGFSQQLQRALQPQRRRLWSDQSADWTTRLTERLQAAEGMVQ